MSDDKHRESISTALTALCDRVEDLTHTLTEQSEAMHETRRLYQDLLANLREVIGDQQKALTHMREAACQEGIDRVIQALIPHDIHENDALGALLSIRPSGRYSRILRKRLKERLGIILFPSDDLKPQGFDGKSRMQWSNDASTEEWMDYRLYALQEGGVPRPNVTYRVIERGWLVLADDGAYRILRKAVIDKAKGRGKRSQTVERQS